jgi:phospholipase C
VDQNGYGLRVPALLVSPYTPRGVVNHTVLDATSALKFIQENWGLPSLSWRDAAATSLSTAFDFNGPERAAQLLPIAPAESGTAAAAGAVYWSYGSASGLIALILIFATVLPWAVRRISLIIRGGSHRRRPGAQSP